MAYQQDIDAPRPVVGGDPLPSTAWHPEFQDVNNDGVMDLFISKGNVNQLPDYAQKDPNNLFLGGRDGTYVERSEAAGIVSYDRGRGAALADFNSDGLLDLVVVNLGTPVRLWRNVGAGSADAPAAMGGWLGVRLHQSGTNRDAIGSIVETKVGDAIIPSRDRGRWRPRGRAAGVDAPGTRIRERGRGAGHVARLARSARG